MWVFQGSNTWNTGYLEDDPFPFWGLKGLLPRCYVGSGIPDLDLWQDHSHMMFHFPIHVSMNWLKFFLSRDLSSASQLLPKKCQTFAETFRGEGHFHGRIRTNEKSVRKNHIQELKPFLEPFPQKDPLQSLHLWNTSTFGSYQWQQKNTSSLWTIFAQIKLEIISWIFWGEHFERKIIETTIE